MEGVIPLGVGFALYIGVDELLVDEVILGEGAWPHSGILKASCTLFIKGRASQEFGRDLSQ